jgi:hypothetical protein
VFYHRGGYKSFKIVFNPLRGSAHSAVEYNGMAISLKKSTVVSGCNISIIFIPPHQSLRITISIFVLFQGFVDDFRTIMLYTRNAHHFNRKLFGGLRNHIPMLEVLNK